MKSRVFRCLIQAKVLILPLLLFWREAVPGDHTKIEKPFIPFSRFVQGATFDKPQKVATLKEKMPDPFWTDKGLFFSRSEILFGLSKAEKKGGAIYDPTSGSFYASVNGCIVRLHEDGQMEVILDGVQGIDIDIRAAKGLAIAREPNDEIVLYKWKGSEVERKTLLAGWQFFNPRFSPDGSMILITESHPNGGRFHVYSLHGAVPELSNDFVGNGYGASWLPDGNGIIFSRIEHDGSKIISSDLWLYDMKSRSELKITGTAKTAEIEPSVSFDGKWLSFVDALTGDLFVVRFHWKEANKNLHE